MAGHREQTLPTLLRLLRGGRLAPLQHSRPFALVLKHTHLAASQDRRMFSANCSTILWCDAMCFSQPGLRLLQGPHGWQVPGFQDSRHSGPSFPGVSRPLISAVMPSRPPPARPLCESFSFFANRSLNWFHFLFQGWLPTEMWLLEKRNLVGPAYCSATVLLTVLSPQQVPQTSLKETKTSSWCSDR